MDHLKAFLDWVWNAQTTSTKAGISFVLLALVAAGVASNATWLVVLGIIGFFAYVAALTIKPPTA